MSGMDQHDEDWWRHGIFYQVYPRSFRDTDGDGVGDLRGITERLPYLASLGVDAVWLSPVFPSPMADFGYDISDYTGIDPLFGTMEDFDALIAAAHEAGLKLILDLVPNHTSDQHPWFVESRSSRDNPKRDWYIWRDPAADGGPPNNWLSEFGGSAWAYDAETGQYYYHAFLAQQPDLNWRNPEVREAIYDAMRFWLRKGVDGFRVDVIWHLIKDAEFRDNPPNPHFHDGRPPHERILTRYSTDQPEVHDVIAEMRRVTDEFGSRVLIGETYLPLHRLVAYYGNDLGGAHLPFNFALLSTLWSARSIEKIIADYEAALAHGRVAELGARQSRPSAGGEPGRTGAGPRRRDAAVDPARHADALLRRRDRHASGDDRARPGARSLREERARDRRRPRRQPDPDAVGRDRDMRAFRRRRRGCRWRLICRAKTSPISKRTRARSCSLYKALIALRKRLPQLASGHYVPVAAQGDLLLYRRAIRRTGGHGRAQSRRRTALGDLERDRIRQRDPAVDDAGPRGRETGGRAGSAQQ